MDAVTQRLLLVGFCIASVVCIGLLVYSKDRANPINRTFFLFNIGLAFWNSGDFFALYFRSDPEFALRADRFAYLGSLVFIQYFVRFHAALSSMIKPPRWAVFLLNGSTPVMAVLVLTPLVIESVHFDGGLVEKPGTLMPLFGAYLLWALLYSIYILIRDYKLSRGARRIQIQYVLAASGMVMLGGLSFATWSFLSDRLPLYYFFEIGYNVLIAYAIIQHGALDVKTVIHKTVLWLATSAVAVVPAVSVYFVAKEWIGGNVALEIGVLWLLLLAMLVYARLIQPGIDHLFQRRRFDLQQVLRRFVEEISETLRFRDVVGLMLEAIRGTLYVDEIHFVRVDGEDTSMDERETLRSLEASNRVIHRDDPAADKAFFDRRQAQVLIPILNEDRLIGLVILGPKRNLAKYSALEIEFLATMKADATIAVRHALLYDSLEQKVQERTQELEASNQKLRELDDLKNKFFANISHELRTPLTLILTPVEVMEMGEMGPLTDQQKQYLWIVRENAVRLLKLINDLLDLAKIDAGKMKMYYVKTAIETVARDVVESARPMADRNRIELKLDCPEAILEFYFDRDKTDKIVSNLLFNALKFTDAGGRVTVSLKREGDRVAIGVADTGVGIPKELLTMVFERFSQIDAASRRKYSGSGIGLALVKEFTEMQNGSVTVDSQPGVGTTFTVRIPILVDLDGPEAEDRRQAALDADVKKRAADWHPRPIPVRRRGERATILVAEDNVELRNFITHQLSERYTVIAVPDGAEALDVVRRDLPDLVISDCMMPTKDGYQLCRDIKNGPATSHIPVVLITAFAEMESQGTLCGADGFLRKPFKISELKEIALQLLTH